MTLQVLHQSQWDSVCSKCFIGSHLTYLSETWGTNLEKKGNYSKSLNWRKSHIYKMSEEDYGEKIGINGVLHGLTPQCQTIYSVCQACVSHVTI
jgi:hypothetical protein